MKSKSPKTPSTYLNESVPRDGRTRRPLHRIYEIHARIRNGSLPNCSTLAKALEVDRKTILIGVSPFGLIL
jgi:hypothetical protein